MGLFKIKYISREGRREEETIVAKTKRLARLQAKDDHDDVLSVRRSPIRWGKILVYLLLAAGVVVLIHLA